MEELDNVKNRYTGVELDVVFKSDSLIFDIYHPPQESKNIFLKDYFLKSNSKLKYWLDYKNLTKENAVTSAEYLERLTKQNHIPPHHIIVESPQVKELIYFKNKGFKTSYYLPANLKNLNQENLLSQVRNIQNAVRNHHPIMISSNSKDYTIMKNFFPNQKKNLWLLANLNDLNTLRSRISLYRRLIDSSVEVVLIKVQD